MTKRGREEYSYRKYVRKSSVTSYKRAKKFKFRTPEMAIRQDAPSMTAQPESPQSVTAAPESPQQQQSPPSEQPPPPN
jgi:hypothetical protein